MIQIKNDNTVYITQGDTLYVQVEPQIKEAGGWVPYTPQEGDVIRFALKSSYRDTVPLILKTIRNDDLLLKLEASETKALKTRGTPYVYDIELTMADGTVDTFIDRAKFYVTEEVH